MNKLIIKKYVDKLTIKDIVNYCFKNNIAISNNESIIIYNFIRTNWEKVLQGDESCFIKLKPQISIELYNFAYNLYQKNKSKVI